MNHPDIREHTLHKMRARVAELLAAGDGLAARRAQRKVRKLAARVSDAYAARVPFYVPAGIVTHVSGAPSSSRYLS